MGLATLHLVIRLGADRYALDAALVEEVVPLVRLTALPAAPVGVAGLMHYRGLVVPVVDLNQLALGVPTPSRTASRIVVVHYAPANRESGSELLGLLVPEATETHRFDTGHLVDGKVATGAPFLGPVLSTPDAIIQYVTVGDLLTSELRDALFPGSRVS